MNTPTKPLALRVIELACRAPSVHNSQPWLWRVVDAATIELRADHRRQLSVSDPSGRNLAVSCGAALHHATVAAQALGLTPAVELVASTDDRNLLVRLRLSPGVPTDKANTALQALEERCTDRRRFTSWPIPDVRLAHLATAASGWGAHAMPITDVTDRFRAEQLLNRAMTVQAADPRFAAEHREWTDHSRTDGMPLANAAPAAHGRPPTRPNRFAPEQETAAVVSPIESSDGLIAICTASDDPLSWLQAGEALSALWLEATHEGLSVVPLSQVIEVEETRQALHHDIFDDMARPQILVRVGWLESTRPTLDRTPRRPIDDVIER